MSEQQKPLERCARCHGRLDQFGRLENAVSLNWKSGRFHKDCAMYERIERQIDHEKHSISGIRRHLSPQTPGGKKDE